MPRLTVIHNNDGRLTFNDNTWISIDSAGLSDKLLGSRIGNEFDCGDRKMSNNGITPERKSARLVEYSTDVRAGLGDTPSIDRNPYNFISFGRTGPWEAPTCNARHDRIEDKAVSGTLHATLTTLTPLFIPKSLPAKGAKSSDFFTCIDPEGNERYAIPGSSLKGSVRSVFEALTNSRMGISSTTPELDEVPLFRRRASRLFRLETLPDFEKNTPGSMWECEFAFLDGRSRVTRQKNHLPEWAREGDYVHENAGNELYVTDWNANSLCVDARHYNHGDKRKLAYQILDYRVDLPVEVARRFLSMKDHRHYRDLFENAQRMPRNYYVGDSEYSPDIHSLEDGDLFFGMTDTFDPRADDYGQRIVCFGRNVNFLWPGDASPKEKLGDYAERPPEKARKEGSSMAEAVFGFVADHSDDDTSHSLKGRVRFGTFWGPCVPSDGTRSKALSDAPVRLMPLTAPPGTKAKCRTLYLKDTSEIRPCAGICWNSSVFILRGRKFYWHQKAPKGSDVALVHQYPMIRDERGPDIPTKQQETCPTINPIRPEVRFEGEIHFSNLSYVELGSLIASLNPEALFRANNKNASYAYGLKLGKARPRGLGSVRIGLKLGIIQKPADRYRSLRRDIEKSEMLKEEKCINLFVQEYRNWASSIACVKDFDQIPFVKDAERLLRLPERDSVRVYPPRFDMYGWGPEWNLKNGEPKRDARVTDYPEPMNLARNLDP